MKKILLIILAFVLVFLGYKFYEKQNALDAKVSVFYGNVDTKTVDLAFRFLGKIEKISKKEGLRVQKGEDIVFMDDSYLRNSFLNLQTKIKLEEINLEKLKSGYRSEEIEQAKAKYEVAMANLKEAQNTFDRQKKLMQANATSKEMFMNSQTTLEAMRANLNLSKANYEQLKNGYRKEDILAQSELVNSLKIQLQSVELDLNNSVLKSPYDGVLQKIYKEAGSMAGANEPVVEIARMDKFFIRAYIDEPRLGSLKLGAKMRVFSDAKKEPYEGYVSFISSVAEFTPKHIQTQELRADLVYKFEVTLSNADERIKQGMPVHIKFGDDKSN